MENTEKILIVDDEPDIAMILKLHLEDAGYLTAWAADGEAALDLIHSNVFPLVLMDIRMPGISGLDVLLKLRDSGSDTSVIMMTAHGNEDLAVKCMQAGATDYVSKPFQHDNLLQRIERALLNRRMQLANKKLEKEKEDFFFMLSHDLKNPITAAVGSIDIMREGRLGPVNEEQIDYLQSAIESCEEVVAMIDNLLDMQRFETGKMQPRIKPVRLADILSTTIKRFTPAAIRDRITLTMNCETTAEVAVDSSLINRVLANLVSNALKFTFEGGSITLSCRCIRHDERHKLRIPVYAGMPETFSKLNCFARISVKDTGSGIPTAELTQIFEPFIQSKTSRERGGTGLGLAFCKKAIESFHGCIWAESDGEQGSQFIILLPCHPGDWRCCKEKSTTRKTV